jgi:hypothetical protein
MHFREAIRFFLLSLVCLGMSSSVARAQVPRRLKDCLPYPALAEEIEDMRAEVRAKMTVNEETPLPAPRVIIDEVKFDAPIHIPDSVQEELVTSIKQRGLGAPIAEWLDETAEFGVRGAWQNNGYFKVKVG